MKRKTKIKLYILCFLLIGLFLISNQANNVKSVDNYSNYLFNQSITIVNDKALIFQETASGTNNYRNYFESNFLFPAKLSTEMFNAYADDYSQYSLSQIYLDNLDNDYAFASNNNSENIYTQQNIQIENFDLINGSIINTSNFYEIIPNVDISHIGWNNYSCNYFYDGINDYPDTENNWIYSLPNAERVAEFELSGNSIYINISTIRVFIRASRSNDWSGSSTHIYVRLKTMYGYTSYQSYSLTSTPENFYFDFNINDACFLNTINLTIKSGYAITTGNLNVFGVKCEVNCSNTCKNIVSNSTEGIGGSYPAEYTFLDEIGKTSTDISFVSQDDSDVSCSAEVIESIDSHTEVMKLHDANGGGETDVRNIFSSSKITGTIEFWIYLSVNTETSTLLLYDGSPSHAIIIYFRYNGYIAYDSGAIHDIMTYSANTWYHFRIEFDCTDDWHLWINQVSKDGGAGYSYYGSPSAMDGFRLITETIGQYDMYLDAIDYSWSSGYYVYRNYIASFSEINIEKEIFIEYLETSEYTPVFLDFYSLISTNVSVNAYILLYNYDIENNITILIINNINEFNEYYFQFNETGQFRLNKFKIFITIEYYLPFVLYVNNFYLNITYVKQNSLGYHDISIKWYKEKDDTTLTGYSLFRVLLYNNSFSYYYIEYNIYTDNYILNWNTINFNESIETFELDCHCRFGLNTLDVEITNILINIYINSINVKKFIEQDRKYFLGKHYKPDFNYTCYNRNYLNLTGIIGNYSYNCLAGIRCLSGENDQVYNRFFTIPLFKESIEVSQRIVAQGTVEIENEPEAPKGSSYWTYTTFHLVVGTTFQTEIGNWSIDYTPILVEQYQAKYYYFPEIIRHGSWGDWTLRFGDLFKIDFNFFQNFLIDILNLILLFFQFLWYLVVASVSFIFMFLGCYIVAFLYNICLYYIFVALIYVVWFLWELLLWLWSVIIWIWTNIIYPFLEWCYNVLLPMIIEAIIIIIAFMLTCFVFIITLGQIDFWVLYAQIYDILWIIVDFIVEWLLIFVQNYEALLMFFILYLIDIGLIYSNYIYSRARGFQKRAERMYYTFELFIVPIVFIWNILCKLLEGTPEL